MEVGVRVRVLGPLEVHCDGGPVPLGTPKQRAVLALLIVRAGAPTTIGHLVAELWAGRPPRSAPDNARMYVNNVRRMLAAVPGAPVVERRGPGYVFTVDPADVDLHNFRELARQGREAMESDDAATAASLFAAGMQLWRGPVLGDVRAGPAVARWCTAVDEERLRTLEELGEALLRAGDAEAAARTARELLVGQPLRETAYALLMRALQAAGDGPGALAAFAAARRALAEQLGVEPGGELLRLRRLVLGRVPARAVPAVAPARSKTTADVVVPRQLPSDIVSFTGRSAHLRRLDGLLPERDGDRAETVVISAVSGTAGVGKTALAVHWAHRVSDRFPDGQLYVNLRGFDPHGSPMSPAEAARGFLDALHVPPQRIPASADAQTSLYRSLLAGRRMLVVLDNARDAEQVRPLLPGSPGCMVLVTSRNRLGGLVAVEGAHPLTLDLLTVDESRRLLARRLGAARVAAEPDAVGDLIVRCAQLPLALAVAAAHAAARPHIPLGALAASLYEARGRLDALDAGDVATEVRAVFSWSYRTLSPGAARLFRLLGLLSGPDVGGPAAASLAGLPAPRTRALLTELTGAHLVTEHVPGRYRLHDLLRVYADELAATDDPAADRAAAVRRVLGHHLHTGYAAAMLLHSYRDPIPLVPLEAGATPQELADREASLAWFTTERAVLLAAVGQATDAGLDVHAWQLAWTLTSFLQRQGHWDEQVTAQRAAMEAARRLGDRSAQSHAHRSLARIYARRGAFDEAHDHMDRASALLVELGDVVGQAHAHHNRSFVYGHQGNYADALAEARRARAIYETVGRRSELALMLNEVGWYLTQLGEPRQALDSCRKALELQRELGNQLDEADCLSNLGYINHMLGELPEAIRCHQSALAVYRATGGDRFHEARVLTHLGETYHAEGSRDAARAAWGQALEILEELGDSDAEQVRAKLDGVRVA